MAKIDYKKELKHLYGPNARDVQFVDVPTMNYLMVDGVGEPGGEAYTSALEALYPLAYTLRFTLRDEGVDYGVMPLEGLWWSDDYTDFTENRRENWCWTMMIMQPDCVTGAHVDAAVDKVRAKKNPVALDKVRFEAMTEGPSAQILHIGPFTDEGPTIEKVHVAIEAAGHALAGKHHEIYLSDIRRAAPEKWRTVIRQPHS